jgi:ribosomal protein L7/L12
MSPNDVEFAELSARVATLERAVAFLLAQVGSSLNNIPAAMGFEDVIELKRQGKVIEAIKTYRQKTNVGLAEAKQFVDNLNV